MSQVPAREHLKTLIEFYHAIEKLHREAEADVVFAKKRRDEARTMKTEAWDRLAEARNKYDITDLDFPVTSPIPQRESSRRLIKKAVIRKSSLRPQEGETSPYPPPPADDEGNLSEDVSPSRRDPLHKETEVNHKLKKLEPIPNFVEQGSGTPGTPQNSRKSKMDPFPNSVEQGLSTPGNPQRPRQSKMVPIHDSAGRGSGTPGTPQRTRKSKMVPIPKLAEQGLSTPGTPQRSRKSTKKLVGSPAGRKSTLGNSMHRKTIPLDSKDIDLPILSICKGRSRDWYEANLDSESLGLAKRFYHAALGTKTRASTNQVHISSVLLNDEWNAMATNTSEVQELYIGVSNTSDGKETLRDRAARALVQPPQREPVAIFFAPKKTRNTDDVYYGGHWRVVAGSMLEPPHVINGMPRQCLAKFIFCGVNPDIVKAVNGD
ncbi:MAG: hypothetical protein SGBAC_004132 [Bacillariaceae sp.]